ncbi:glycosyltransferase family 4 protein [Haloarcula sp. H-GB5]
MSQNDDQSQDPLTIIAINKKSWKNQQPGGAEINLEQTLTRLSNYGHDVHLLTGGETNRPREEVANGVRIRRVGQFDLPSPWDIIITYILVNLYYYVASRKISPDVIYTVNSPLPWIIISQIPKVSIYHHLTLDSFSETHPFPQNIIGYYSELLGVYIDRGKHVISVSPSTTDTLCSRGHQRDKIHEIKNGLNHDALQPGQDRDEPSILFIGKLERYKGADRLPEIHKLTKQKLEKSIRLDIAGRDGPEKDLLQNYCENNNDAVFHGYVSESEKVELLQSAWVLAVPSRVEGYGIAVIEANACGTPAVGADVEGVRDSIIDGKTGLLSDAGDIDEFAEDISSIIENMELRHSLEGEAVKWAKEHSWGRAASSLEHTFYLVVNKNN